MAATNFKPEPYNADATADWLICAICGTQFPTSSRAALTTCRICDDPRQYVPPTGPAFTTMADLRRAGHRNVFTPYGPDPRLVSVASEPRVGIGQRAILVRTPRGNVLWDCISLLDEDTVAEVNGMGGLAAIVISHPHFYSSHVQWARAFGCPVYLAAEDLEWTTMKSSHQVALTDTETTVPGTDIAALKLGGHFPGSLALLWERRLLHADTLLATPAGVGRWEADAAGAARERPPGLNTFAFLWSVPNAIPLGPRALAAMWEVLRGREFDATHGGIPGHDIEDRGVKGRVLESMKIQLRAMEHETHPLVSETLEA